MFRNRFKTTAIGFTISSAVVLMLSLAMAAPAFADGGGGGGGTLTPNIDGSAGLSVINYPTYNSGAPLITGTVLNGLDKTLTIKMPLTVTDASGTGNGWILYGDVQQFHTGLTSATFHTIDASNIAFSGPVVDTGSSTLTDSSTGEPIALGCVTGSQCSKPDILTASGIQLYVEPASMPTDGTVVYNTTNYSGNVIAQASPTNGMGKMNIEADFTVNLPAKTTYAGTYSSVFAVTFGNTPV